MRDDRRICFHSVTFTFKSGRAPSFSCEILTSYYTSPASTRGCRFIRHLDSNGKTLAFPDGASSKESACQCRRCKRLGFDLWIWKVTWSRKWYPMPNSMGRGAWQSVVHGASESWAWLNTHTYTVDSSGKTLPYQQANWITKLYNLPWQTWEANETKYFILFWVLLFLIYFWLPWVFIAVYGLFLVAEATL